MSARIFYPLAFALSLVTGVCAWIIGPLEAWETGVEAARRLFRPEFSWKRLLALWFLASLPAAVLTLRCLRRVRSF